MVYRSWLNVMEEMSFFVGRVWRSHDYFYIPLRDFKYYKGNHQLNHYQSKRIGMEINIILDFIISDHFRSI